MIRAAISRALARALAVCLLLALSGCGLVSLGYPRLPDLGLLWMERQVSLNADQAQQWRRDLQDALAWHRRNQLLPTADLLQRWQTMASTEFSADEVCREADSVRRLVETAAPQLLPALVRLARSLDAEQRQALAQSQAKSLAEFRDTHLGGASASWGGWLPRAQAQAPDPGQRQPATGSTDTGGAVTPPPPASAAAQAASLAKRLEQAVDRYEMLYGRLNATQTQALRATLERSSFDAQRLLAERERRSQDLLQALADTASAAPGAESGPLSGWMARLQASPTPGHTAYARRLQEEGCAQMATLHRLATPAQRQKAVATLASYEADLRRLAQP